MSLLQAQGLEDTTTEVTYTVMIWYTPEFLASFASETDMGVFIDLIFEETNQGYINSQMPVIRTKIPLVLFWSFWFRSEFPSLGQGNTQLLLILKILSN